MLRSVLRTGGSPAGVIGVRDHCGRISEFPPLRRFIRGLTDRPAGEGPQRPPDFAAVWARVHDRPAEDGYDTYDLHAAGMPRVGAVRSWRLCRRNTSTGIPCRLARTRTTRSQSGHNILLVHTTPSLQRARARTARSPGPSPVSRQQPTLSQLPAVKRQLLATGYRLRNSQLSSRSRPV